MPLNLLHLDGTKFSEVMSNLECLCSRVAKGLVLCPCCKLYLSLHLSVFPARHQKWKHIESVKTVNFSLKRILIEKILSPFTWELLMQKGQEDKGFYNERIRLVRRILSSINYSSFSGVHALAWQDMGKMFPFNNMLSMG